MIDQPQQAMLTLRGFDADFGGEIDEQVKDGDMSMKSENVTV